MVFVINKRNSYLQLQQNFGKWWRENSAMTDKKYEAYLNDRLYTDKNEKILNLLDKNNSHEQNDLDDTILYTCLNDSCNEFYDCLETLKADWTLYTGDTHGNIKKWNILDQELTDSYDNFHGDFIQNITITPYSNSNINIYLLQ